MIPNLEKVQKMSQGQLTADLHNFGTSSYFTKRRQELPSTTMRRVQKRIIFVQPESAKRRKCSFKGRKALPQGNSSCIIPEKVVIKIVNINSLSMSEKISLPLKSIPNQCYQQLATQLQL